MMSSHLSTPAHSLCLVGFLEECEEESGILDSVYNPRSMFRLIQDRRPQTGLLVGLCAFLGC